MLLQDSHSALARDVSLGLQGQIQIANRKTEVLLTWCLTSCMPLTSEMPFGTCAFSTDGRLIFLSSVLSNPHGTFLYFKGWARNWAMTVYLKEVQAHFCPQTNPLDSHLLPCWQNHARTFWLCLGFQIGLRKQGESCANVGMGMGLVVVMHFILHSQFTALDLDFLVLPWLSGLWLALQSAVKFLTGLSSPCWKDKAPELCLWPHFSEEPGEWRGSRGSKKGERLIPDNFPKHLMGVGLPRQG